MALEYYQIPWVFFTKQPKLFSLDDTLFIGVDEFY